MKKIITSILLLLFNKTGLFAQTRSDRLAQLSKPELRYYNTKAKHQWTAGFVLTGGGIGLVITSVAATSFQNLGIHTNTPLLTFLKTPGFQLTLTQKLF